MSFRIATRTDAPDPESTNTRSKPKAKRILFRIVLPIISVCSLVAAVVIANVATRAATPKTTDTESGSFTTPLSNAKCVSDFKVTCYTPAQYQAAYNLTSLYNGEATGGRPITGAGETIVIMAPYGSPTIAHDLHVFDARFKLPDPTLTIEQFGKIPPLNPNDALMAGAAQEATLAVEYTHAIAPGATIVLAETAAITTVGATGVAQMMDAQESLIKRGIGDVFLETITNAENTFPGFASGNYSSLLNLRYAFQDAYAHHATVIAPSGDTGVTQVRVMAPPWPTYKYRVGTWPATDPLVTAVGGTALKLNASGGRMSPDIAWNNFWGASGGGTSSVFSRPQYQNEVAGVVGGHRGTPDISMSASPGCWGYYSFPGGTGPGWHILGGSTEAAPLMAGIVALADQLAGHRLGLINPALYQLAERQQAGDQAAGIVSITSGNNNFDGVTGYHASAGYNMDTGWGTIDAAKFVPALARLG